MDNARADLTVDDSPPRLRHEFVGMMFAITIGEVGLQVAALVQAGHTAHYLPAYTHLFLATIMIATSWVGWSVSMSPGARLELVAIFQWEFVVLLLDVALVITYFILVRAVDFGREGVPPRIAPPSTLAFWTIVIFALYLAWDIVTKIIIYRKPETERQWIRKYGSRMIPTGVCLILAFVVRLLTGSADLPHYLTADFALLCLVLLFRASKDFVSARIPKKKGDPIDWSKVWRASVWTLLCVVGLTLGLMATSWSWHLPIPESITKEIQAPLPANSDTPESTVPTLRQD